MTVAVPEPPHLVTDLKTLCLATMTAEWRPLAAQATRERQPPAENLAQLVHLEVTGRRERRIQRRLQEARFPMLKTLDAFQIDAQPESWTATRSCRCAAAPSSPRLPTSCWSAASVPARPTSPSPWAWPAASTTIGSCS